MSTDMARNSRVPQWRLMARLYWRWWVAIGVYLLLLAILDFGFGWDYYRAVPWAYFPAMAVLIALFSTPRLRAGVRCRVGPVHRRPCGVRGAVPFPRHRPFVDCVKERAGRGLPGSRAARRRPERPIDEPPIEADLSLVVSPIAACAAGSVATGRRRGPHDSQFTYQQPAIRSLPDLLSRCRSEMASSPGRAAGAFRLPLLIGHFTLLLLDGRGPGI